MTRSVHIRPACPDDAAAIARVHVDSWRTTEKMVTVGGKDLREIGNGWDRLDMVTR